MSINASVNFEPWKQIQTNLKKFECLAGNSSFLNCTHLQKRSCFFSALDTGLITCWSTNCCFFTSLAIILCFTVLFLILCTQNVHSKWFNSLYCPPDFALWFFLIFLPFIQLILVFVSFLVLLFLAILFECCAFWKFERAHVHKTWQR